MVSKEPGYKVPFIFFKFLLSLLFPPLFSPSFFWISFPFLLFFPVFFYSCLFSSSLELLAPFFPPSLIHGFHFPDFSLSTSQVASKAISYLLCSASYICTLLLALPAPPWPSSVKAVGRSIVVHSLSVSWQR